ncbi:MAG TPA: hypothetical protein VGE85_02520 [Terracidiphilus sp.]|jgi:hypothetical protein
MRKLLLAAIIAMPMLGTCAAYSENGKCNDETQFPGAYLKWVKIAEPVFQKEHLNLDKYNIVIFDEPDSITVLLRSTDATCEGMGSTGSRPDFAVEISKKDKKIMNYNYQR